MIINSEQIDLQVVYEESSCEGFSGGRVGLRIQNRIFWFSYMDNFCSDEARKDYEKWRKIAQCIVFNCSTKNQ